MPANPISLKEMEDHIAGMIDQIIKDFQFTWIRNPQDLYLFYVPSTEKEWGEFHLIGGTMEDRNKVRELFLQKGKKTYPVDPKPLSPGMMPHIMAMRLRDMINKLPIVPWG